MNFIRYLTLYLALWKNSVTREMSFKGNFILWIVVELLWFGLQLSFVSVVFSQTDSVGTWSKWQMVLLVGASNFIQQLYQAFFLTNCTNLSELVRTGRMDFLLLLPVNTRFLVSLRVVDLGAFINALFGLCVMIFAAAKLNLHPTGGATGGLRRAVRGGGDDSLLADVHPGDDLFLDGSGAGDCLGLLQSVQHRTDAGRGVQGRVQGGFASASRSCW